LKKRFTVPAAVETELGRVKKEWRDYLSTFTLHSPDPETNTMVNVWNQYQCKTTFDWSRYISFYENGEGRGMGTRDSCQDTLAVNSQLPGRVKQRIQQILSTCQFETGDTYHQFFPLGHKGDLKGFSDDQLWIPQMVYAYIAETGDAGVLKTPVRYADSEKTADVYTHLVDALNYTARMVGPHGLPLILTADWNDTLHLWMECEQPESVLTGELYVYALKLTAEMAMLVGKPEDAREFSDRAAAMTRLINEQCWDGEWYLRGFGSEVIGTKASPVAKIFLNSQVWAVIAGVAGPERAAQCMDSVRKYLFCSEGVKKLWPSFDHYDQTYGLISRYNVGRKENGIFAHTNAWVVVAESLLRRPEYAYEYYKTILPLRRNDRAEVLKTEPYIFCQTLGSDEAHDKGEGANSWLTGTASWMYVAATQYLLGIRPALEGLMIDPVLPSAWDGFQVDRFFQGCRYDIRVRRGGEESLTVDGARIDGKVIKPDPGKKQRMVEVRVK
jgi:cellobiose phosphorylase